MFVLDKAHIEIVTVDLDALPTRHDLLDADENRRARAFLRPQDGHRFAAAHGLLRQLLGLACGEPPASLVWGVRESGKPWLPAHPRLGFNLSHAGPIAVIALGRDLRVGVDVEHLARSLDWRGIASHYFSADECRAIGDGEGAARRFYTLWTAKEAVLKAIGCGLSALDNAPIALDREGRPRLLHPLNDEWHLTPLHEVGHPAALVYDGPTRMLRHWRWPLPVHLPGTLHDRDYRTPQPA